MLWQDLFLLKLKFFLHYLSVSPSLSLYTFNTLHWLCSTYTVYQAVPSLFPPLCLPLCPCSFSLKLSHTLENKHPRGLKVEHNTQHCHDVCFMLLPLFLSVLSVWIYIIFHHLSLSSFIPPFCFVFPEVCKWCLWKQTSQHFTYGSSL